jgi:hypothetical protein
MRIVFYISAPQKGVMISIANELESRGYEISFILRDSNVERVVRDRMTGTYPVIVMSSVKINLSSDIASQCVDIEGRYKFKFSEAIAHDRALGKGYLLNAPGHPDIIRSWDAKYVKYKELLEKIVSWEVAVQEIRPDMVVSVDIPLEGHLICKASGIPVRILTPPRFSSLYRWTVNEKEECPALSRALDERVSNYLKEKSVDVDVELKKTEFAQYFFNQRKYSYWSAFVGVCKRVLVESKQLIRRNHNLYRRSYKYLGWIKPLVVKPYLYRYVCKKGKTVSDLGSEKIVLFPLQFEPEASLTHLSPELNNSSELITWVSKNLPADYMLVVKEQPDAYGIRSKSYYDNFLRMANVVLAHPKVGSDEWLNKSSIVVSLTSTMAFEAVINKKPVLSYGKHQVINRLPTVVYSDSFDSTKEKLTMLAEMSSDSDYWHKLNVSSIALDEAFKMVCFDFSGYEKLFGNCDFHMDMAKVAVDNLIEHAWVAGN